MKLLITEQQLKLIIEIAVKNFKPAEIIDQKYGTNLAQHYNFPGGYSEDEVWNMWSSSGNKIPKELVKMCDDLDETYFPYSDVSSLPREMKLDILCGMSSCINVDDIVWFSIVGVKAYMNTKVHEEQKKMGLYGEIQWVMSPQSLLKLKDQLR